MREQCTRESKISCCSPCIRERERLKDVQRTSRCSLTEGCGAPICPLSPAGVWFADEPVCRSRKHGAGVRWVKVQRRIARLTQAVGYFTQADLERIRKVRRGIRGRNPDADRRQNAGAQHGTVSRGGVLRAYARSLDSKPMTETNREADVLSSPMQSA